MHVASIQQVLTELVQTLTSTAVGRVRLQSELEARFIELGEPPLRATELAERLAPAVLERVDEALGSWDMEHLSRPLVVAKSSCVVRGVTDPKYDGGLAGHFFEVLGAINSASDHVLLGIASLYCFAIGCDKVFVVDKGGGDAGVDVLGRLPRIGRTTHFLLAVQCKAHAKPLSPLELDAIAHRFRSGLGENNRWNEYLRATSARELRMSAGITFGVLASRGLSALGATKAQEQGLFSSSPRQVAHLLSSRWSGGQVASLAASVPTTRDLARNLASEFAAKEKL